MCSCWIGRTASFFLKVTHGAVLIFVADGIEAKVEAFGTQSSGGAQNSDAIAAVLTEEWLQEQQAFMQQQQRMAELVSQVDSLAEKQAALESQIESLKVRFFHLFPLC